MNKLLNSIIEVEPPKHLHQNIMQQLAFNNKLASNKWKISFSAAAIILIAINAICFTIANKPKLKAGLNNESLVMPLATNNNLYHE